MSRQRKTARQILQYILEHPDGKDTMEGILKWWLPKALFDQEEKIVKEALDFLVSKGWMTEKKISPFQNIYGVNKERLDEVKVFLSELRRL